MPPDHNSRAPQYRFSDTLEAQESELTGNPLLVRYAASREALAADPHRPLYHFVTPEGPLNDPNGFCFWEGNWHLFYQAYPKEDPRLHWGHAVSEDLVHWRDLPLALHPGPEHDCFSGSIFIDGDRAIAAYHGTRAGTMIAESRDPLLLNWTKLTGGPVIPIPQEGEKLPYNVFDPCIWKEDDAWYLLTAGARHDKIGGKKRRAEFLHRSTDLERWEYLHPFLEDDYYGLVGDDGACPYFWPLGGKHILLHYSHMSGGKYLIGEYDTDRQKLQVRNGGTFCHGLSLPGGVHAPSSFPDGRGGVVAIFNMNPAKPTEGWDQIMTLPLQLNLAGEDGLTIRPCGNLAMLRQETHEQPDLALPANQTVTWDAIAGNSLEIEAEIAMGETPSVELHVCRSPGEEETTRVLLHRSRRRGYTIPDTASITLDTARSSTAPDVDSRSPETVNLAMDPADPIRLRVFIDRSVVEVFVNDRAYLASRIYPERPDSTGVAFRAQGREARVKALRAWHMRAVWPVG